MLEGWKYRKLQFISGGANGALSISSFNSVLTVLVVSLDRFAAMTSHR
jgi:hypothetical protein